MRTQASILPQETSALLPVSFWKGNGLSILTGDRAIFRLSHSWMVRLCLGGFSVHIVDCAIRLNVFSLVEEAILHEQLPEEILEQITVQRAFTPYQLLDVLDSALQKPQPKLYVLLAPAKQFLDGDVGKEEGLHLFEVLLKTLSKMQSRNLRTLVVEKEQYKHSSFSVFFPKLKELSNQVWELTSQTEIFGSGYVLRSLKEYTPPEQKQKLSAA